VHQSNASSAAAGFLRGGDRGGDLVTRRHAGREDQRKAGRCSGADQRQIRDLERRDLEGRHAEPDEEVDRRSIEGTTERGETDLGGPSEDGLVPAPRGVGLLVELIEVPPGPETLRVLNPEVVAVDISVIVSAV
jgi:hypothetical protein